MAGVYGLERSAWRGRVADLSRRLAVVHLLGVPLRRLSLGERAKLELIATVLHRPEVLFLDEPTLGLDAASRREVRAFLREEALNLNLAMGVGPGPCR